MPGASGSGSGGSGRLALPRVKDPRVVVVFLAAATTALLLWVQMQGKAPKGKGSKTQPKPAVAGETRREELSKAMDEVSTLREHVDELEESLTRHQQQTAAIIAPLRQELASLKQQLEILHFAADGRLKAPVATAAYGPTTASSSSSSNNNNNNDDEKAVVPGSDSGNGNTSYNNNPIATNNNSKRRCGAHDAGAVLLGPGEAAALEEQQQSHLATVALALGVASPSRKGSKASFSSAVADRDLTAASPRDGNGFIISDWGDFH